MPTPVGGCFAQGMPPLMKQAYTCALTNRAFSAAASSAPRCDSLEVRLGAVAAAAGAVAAAAGAVAAAAADGGLITGAAASESASSAPVTAANAEVSNEKVCGAGCRRSMWRLRGWWSAVWRGRAWAWAPSAIGDYGGAGTPTAAAVSMVGAAVERAGRYHAPSWPVAGPSPPLVLWKWRTNTPRKSRCGS